MASSSSPTTLRPLTPSLAQVNNLTRFAPEPRSRLGLSFGSVMRGVASAVRENAGTFAGINTEYLDLINKQIEVQQQMQLVSLHSNIEKSRHETRMAAVRNVRSA